MKNMILKETTTINSLIESLDFNLVDAQRTIIMGLLKSNKLDTAEKITLEGVLGLLDKLQDIGFDELEMDLAHLYEINPKSIHEKIEVAKEIILTNEN